MRFWGERFKRDDEEDIWEELKQELLNPPSEIELFNKKKLEETKINEVLEKMFSDKESIKVKHKSQWF